MGQVNVNIPPSDGGEPAGSSGAGFILGIIVAIIVLAVLVYVLVLSPPGGGTTDDGGDTTEPAPSGWILGTSLA